MATAMITGRTRRVHQFGQDGVGRRPLLARINFHGADEQVHLRPSDPTTATFVRAGEVDPRHGRAADRLRTGCGPAAGQALSTPAAKCHGSRRSHRSRNTTLRIVPRTVPDRRPSTAPRHTPPWPGTPRPVGSPSTSNTRRCPRSGPPGRRRTLSRTATSFWSRDPPWDARRRYWILITGFGSTRRRRWSVMGIPQAPALRLEGRCRR